MDLSKYHQANAGYVQTNLMSTSQDLEYQDTLYVDNIDFNFIIQDHSGLNRARKLVFKNCFFQGTVNLNITGRTIQLILLDCKFLENVIIAGDLRALTICNSTTFEKNVEIARSNQTPTVITAIACNGELKFSGSYTNFELIDINESVPGSGSLYITMLSSDTVNISNSKFSKIDIEGSALSNFFIRESEVGIFQLRNSSTPSITFLNSSISESYTSEGCKDKMKLNISSEKQFGNIILRLNHYNNINLSGISANECKINGTGPDKIIVEINLCTFFKLLISRTIINGTFSLKQVTVPKGGVFGIIQSDLKTTDFVNCNFSKASLEFENSKITEIFISETTFPKFVTTNGKENNGQAQVAFGQLTQAFQKQGDTIRKVEYQSREIEAHYKSVPLSSFFTKFSLWLNRISNNFGRSWQRGVVFTFGVGLIFFYLMVVFSNTYKFGFPVVLDSRLLTSFFRFMNPIRIVDTEQIFLKNDQQILNMSSGSYFFDFLGRIMLAYGYYQTIQAFRKFGRN